eukprot:CAMPEP_0113903750 /NCGR_PEP_ID=MMETSP0780_2-20120614/22764_1 /TAXON_ID=652834 /ORGANISM="Palpitomonas bilix" /LENGTH=201 /DNA_ID=CAMNT_0000897071 /DNA_START=48 /DNA_END=653 /DNA_ORIENTATION=- /assembly_acc=CAM_ASM_000599
MMEDMHRHFFSDFSSPFPQLEGGEAQRHGEEQEKEGQQQAASGEQASQLHAQQGDKKEKEGRRTSAMTRASPFQGGLNLFGRDFAAPSCSIDVRETDDKYLIDAAAPGFNKDNFHVSVHGNNLILEGTAKSEVEEGNDDSSKGHVWHRREISSGSFKRGLRLPSDADVDAIAGKWGEGILHLEVPRKAVAAEAGPRRVQIE